MPGHTGYELLDGMWNQFSIDYQRAVEEGLAEQLTEDHQGALDFLHQCPFSVYEQ
ncbi:hypothetical protein IMZ48_39195 [Candidatus Bathyarchaeota archaeon]|nr:hypothetical protein [Candidatus Bathyarchaeota archaeon]